MNRNEDRQIFMCTINTIIYTKLDGVPVPERVKTATRQMIISHFLLVIFRYV